MTNPFSCPRCHLLCEENDNYCRHCGHSLKPGQGFFHSHGGIILLAILVGPFALPAVWTSKQISFTAKWIYSVALVAMGIYLVVACYQMYQLMMSAAQGILGGGF